jgi:hypothetical protein
MALVSIMASFVPLLALTAVAGVSPIVAASRCSPRRSPPGSSSTRP